MIVSIVQFTIRITGFDTIPAATDTNRRLSRFCSWIVLESLYQGWIAISRRIAWFFTGGWTRDSSPCKDSSESRIAGSWRRVCIRVAIFSAVAGSQGSFRFRVPVGGDDWCLMFGLVGLRQIGLMWFLGVVAIGPNSIVISPTHIFKFPKRPFPTLYKRIILSLYKWGQKQITQWTMIRLSNVR